MRCTSSAVKSSWVSERIDPVLLIAALIPAMASESGASTMALPSWDPNIQYIDSRLPPTLSSTPRTAVSRSAGFSIMAAMASGAYENSARYFGIDPLLGGVSRRMLARPEQGRHLPRYGAPVAD